MVRNLPANAGDLRDAGSIHGSPLQCPCLDNPHGQRTLAGYSRWGHKESDATEATWHANFEASNKEQSIITALKMLIIHYSIS